MPEIAAMIATAGLVTQFLKNLLLKVNVPVEGRLAVILSIVVSLAVVVYYTITTGSPWGINTVILAVQVIIGANAGYSLLKVARNPN